MYKTLIILVTLLFICSYAFAYVDEDIARSYVGQYVIVSMKGGVTHHGMVMSVNNGRLLLWELNKYIINLDIRLIQSIALKTIKFGSYPQGRVRYTPGQEVSSTVNYGRIRGNQAHV